MTSRDFCFWLNGFFELGDADGKGIMLTPKQVKQIQDHLAMVFIHEIDPSMGTKAEQKLLSEAHNGPTSPLHTPHSPPVFTC